MATRYVAAPAHAGAREARRPARRRRFQMIAAVTGKHLILALFALACGGPFLWMALTSFKSVGEVLASPPTFLPKTWRFDNYTQIFTIAPFGQFYVTSVITAALSTVGQVFTSLAAGFAFARLKFRGRSLLFAVLLAALMVPFELVFTPLVSLLSSLGWLNSYQGLVIPNIPSILGVFLFRQFFSNFSHEIEDASRIDGAGVWRRFWSIMTPMAAPMIGSFAILSFVYNWNNFFFQLVVVTKTKYFTVQLGLSLLQSAEGASSFNLLMAASTLAVVPVLLVYLLLQKHIIKAVSGQLK